jgi:hypothetical protein
MFNMWNIPNTYQDFFHYHWTQTLTMFWKQSTFKTLCLDLVTMEKAQVLFSDFTEKKVLYSYHNRLRELGIKIPQYHDTTNAYNLLSNSLSKGGRLVFPCFKWSIQFAVAWPLLCSTRNICYKRFHISENLLQCQICFLTIHLKLITTKRICA